jgi:hypothetical protein
MLWSAEWLFRPESLAHSFEVFVEIQRTICSRGSICLVRRVGKVHRYQRSVLTRRCPARPGWPRRPEVHRLMFTILIASDYTSSRCAAVCTAAHSGLCARQEDTSRVATIRTFKDAVHYRCIRVVAGHDRVRFFTQILPTIGTSNRIALVATSGMHACTPALQWLHASPGSTIGTPNPCQLRPQNE